MDETSEQLAPSADCTDNKCSVPTPLEESTDIMDDLRQQVQCWRQKLDECVKQNEVLDNLLHQTRREKDTLLSRERKKQNHLQLQLNSAEEKIKAYEKQLTNSAQSSNSTCSAGVSTSEVQSGCRACVKITEELNALKLEYDKIIRDLELKNTQFAEENKSLHSKLLIRNQNVEQVHEQKETERSVASLTAECKEWKQKNQQQEHTINDLQRRLKEAECEIDEKSNLLKHNVEENNNLRGELDVKKDELKNMTQRNEKLEDDLLTYKKDTEKLRQQNQQQYQHAINANLKHLKGAKYGSNEKPKLLEDFTLQAENVKYEGEARNEKFKNAEWRMRPRLRSLPTQKGLLTSVSVKSNLLESKCVKEHDV